MVLVGGGVRGDLREAKRRSIRASREGERTREPSSLVENPISLYGEPVDNTTENIRNQGNFT